MKVSKRRRVPDESEQLVSSSKSSLTFDKSLEIFLSSQEARRHSKYTLNGYKYTLRGFFAYMSDQFSYTDLEQIMENDVLAWLAYLRTAIASTGKPYSSKSIQTYCRNVISFFHWMSQHDHLSVNPISQLREPKADKTLIRVFSDDELKRLDAACDQSQRRGMTPDECKALGSRDRAILWLLLSTGIRSAELCGLLFSDIDWDKGMIYVRGKGAKERRIPFGKVARQYLNAYVQYWRGVPTIKGDDHVFLTVSGRPMSSWAMFTLFERLKKGAGIDDKRVSPHTCRHWFAVNCIKRGMPTIALKGLLGHESWKMIEIYVHLAEQDNVTLYVQHSPVDALEMHHSAKGRREAMREWRQTRGHKLKD